MTTDRSDVYRRVTDQIVAELEAGVRPWAQKSLHHQPTKEN